MKDHLVSLAERESVPAARLNLVREYLQACILRSIQDAGGFAFLAFQGGTALRFLHGLRRFSEDLDFSLERGQGSGDLPGLMKRTRRDLELSGYRVEIVLRESRPVHTARIKFLGLLHDTGLAPLRGQKLMVRVDLDTRPPAGACLETRLVTRHFPILFRAHDLASCMAGKLHAILARPHAKGRDLFDLAWYLTHPDRPAPNLNLLRAALEQTRWTGKRIGEKSWKPILAESISRLDWSAVRADVEPFLEDPRDLLLLDRQLLLAELQRSGR